jgi:hypothetical protein
MAFRGDGLRRATISALEDDVAIPRNGFPKGIWAGRSIKLPPAAGTVPRSIRDTFRGVARGRTTVEAVDPLRVTPEPA